ncbi:MAG: hypothetical protein HY075_02815 [Deltaproteobacteria bacterium]|nr:hypothetical protein [Deltaproteobacteria bacterium]
MKSNSMFTVSFLLLTAFNRTAVADCNVPGPAGKLTDLGTISETIEGYELARPLHDFLKRVPAEYKQRIAEVYRDERDMKGLKSGLDIILAPIKKRFDRTDGGAEYSVFLSETEAGLHPHLYASSCVKDGSRDRCLTIDLLNQIPDGVELAANVAKQKRELSCYGGHTRSEGLGSKVVEVARELIERFAAKRNEGGKPAAN